MSDQVEAAQAWMVRARWPIFFYITLPHLKRAISVVVMIEMIFLLDDLRRNFCHHLGRTGAGHHQPGLPDLHQARCSTSTWATASAGGVIAIILANLVAIFLVRTVARTLEV